MEKNKTEPVSIRTKITFLAFGIFFISLLIVGIVVENTVVASFEDSLSEDAMDIALAVASIPAIQKNVGKDGVASIIDTILAQN